MLLRSIACIAVLCVAHTSYAQVLSKENALLRAKEAYVVNRLSQSDVSCISFEDDAINGNITFSIMEIHDRRCGGDPRTDHRITDILIKRKPPYEVYMKKDPAAGHGVPIQDTDWVLLRPPQSVDNTFRDFYGPFFGERSTDRDPYSAEVARFLSPSFRRVYERAARCRLLADNPFVGGAAVPQLRSIKVIFHSNNGARANVSVGLTSVQGDSWNVDYRLVNGPLGWLIADVGR